MATIEEIMAAKDPQFKSRLFDQLGQDLQSKNAADIIAARLKPQPVDDTMEITPETRAPPEVKTGIKAVSAPLPTVERPANLPTPPPTTLPSATPVPQQMAGDQAPAASQPNDELAQLQQMQEAADRDASNREMWRRVAANFSQGQQSENKLDLSDIEATRKRPLEMYQQRQAAKALALKTLLDTAQAKHYGAETAAIPQRLAAEQQRIGIEGQRATTEASRAEEEKRYHDLEAKVRREGYSNAVTLEQLRQAGENLRNKPYDVKINPITGEQEMYNLHTGKPTGEKTPMDPEVVQAFQERKLLNPADQAQLAASRKAQEDLGTVDTSKAGATWLERAAPKQGLLHNLSDYVSNNVLRSDEERQARAQALKAGDAAIKAMAGARGFSGTEMPQLQQFAISPTDTPEQMLSKIKAAAPELQRDIGRIENKLPIKHQGGGGQPAVRVVGGKKMYQDPKTGKVKVIE